MISNFSNYFRVGTQFLPQVVQKLLRKGQESDHTVGDYHRHPVKTTEFSEAASMSTRPFYLNCIVALKITKKHVTLESPSVATVSWTTHNMLSLYSAMTNTRSIDYRNAIDFLIQSKKKKRSLQVQYIVNLMTGFAQVVSASMNAVWLLSI